MIRSSGLMTRTERARYFLNDAAAAARDAFEPGNTTESSLVRHRW